MVNNARIVIKISSELKKDFSEWCNKYDTNQAALLRRFIKAVVGNEDWVIRILLFILKNPEFEDKYKNGRARE